MLDENPSVERKVLRALARRVLDLSRDPTLARLGPLSAGRESRPR